MLWYRALFFHLSSGNTTQIIYCSTTRLLITQKKVRDGFGGFWYFSGFLCCCVSLRFYALSSFWGFNAYRVKPSVISTSNKKHKGAFPEAG